ncbi:MAG: M24 family metallopeptidase, partial [Cyanobacteria bacterium J06648_11]
MSSPRRAVARDRRIPIRSDREIDCMRRAGGIVGDLLEALQSRLAPGWSTADIDRFAETYIRDRGALPSFKGYRGFPAAACVCLNHELVHGLPANDRLIASGDLVKIDVGACVEGWHADSSLTVPIAPLTARDRHLIDSVESALAAAIELTRHGVALQAIAAAIQDSLEASGLTIPHHYI